MPSAAYEQALRECTKHHAQSKTFSGRLLRPHKKFLTALLQRHGAQSVLDYGAGKGEQYSWVDPEDGKTLEQAWGVDVCKYDPAWPPYADEPQGVFDIVICTHVLGSIPKADLPFVIRRIMGFATKAVFIAEKIGPIKKNVLSNPKIFPHGWHAIDWIDAIAPHRREGIETHLVVRYKSDHGAFTGHFAL